MQTTTLNRSWLIKSGIISAVFLGFGLWGLYDALVVYPDRGVRSADFLKYQYLQAVQTSLDSGVAMLPESVSVPDPGAELERLSKLEPASMRPRDAAKLRWLEAVSYVGDLRPESTTISDPRAALENLTQSWTGQSPPKPLTKWDIPVQWLIMALGTAGGLYGAGLILRVWRQRYRFDPGAKALTLPDGSTLRLEDIEDFDRRKWDKFLMFVRVKPGHSPHGGKELRLDLLRHVPLESWVVEMEHTLFPDRKEADDDGGEGESTPGGVGPESGKVVGDAGGGG